MESWVLGIGKLAVGVGELGWIQKMACASLLSFLGEGAKGAKGRKPVFGGELGPPLKFELSERDAAVL